MDYKELIRRLMGCDQWDEAIRNDELSLALEDAADAIETLLAERDAAAGKLLAFRTCSTCKNSEENKKSGKPCIFGSVCTGQYWKWRGQQKEGSSDGQA